MMGKNPNFCIAFVRDNQRLAKDFNARRGGKEPPDAKRRLAIDYPAYSMVICQVIDELKLVLLFAGQYLKEWVKICYLWPVSASILPDSNQTQR